MQEHLHVYGIQADLVWENPEQNRAFFEQEILQAPTDVDLFVLPEMFSTGFTMNPVSQAESMQGPTIQWMQSLAQQTQAALVGSLIIKEEEKYYNRCVFVYPSGELKTYDKRHLFTLAGEHTSYEQGKHLLVVDYKGWKLCPLICYDLRFPVWSRNTSDYDVLVYMANWPTPRVHAWTSLLKARAIENMSYCIGVNRVGHDKNDYTFSGHSAVYDYLGAPVHECIPNEVSSFGVRLSKSMLEDMRKKLNFLNDKDHFTLSY